MDQMDPHASYSTAPETTARARRDWPWLLVDQFRDKSPLADPERQQDRLEQILQYGEVAAPGVWGQALLCWATEQGNKH